MLKFRQNTIIIFLKKIYSHIEYTLLACTQFFTINLKHGLIFPGIKLELNFKLYYTILNFFCIFIWSFSWIILCSCSASLSVAKPSETSDFCSTCDGSGSRFSPGTLDFLQGPFPLGCACYFLWPPGFLNSLHTIKISAIAAINLCPWQVKMVLHKNDPLSLVTLPFLNGFSAPEPFFCELQCQDTLQPILCEWKFVWIFVRI